MKITTTSVNELLILIKHIKPLDQEVKSINLRTGLSTYGTWHLASQGSQCSCQNPCSHFHRCICELSSGTAGHWGGSLRKRWHHCIELLNRIYTKGTSTVHMFKAALLTTNICPSVRTLKPLTGKVRNINHLVTMQFSAVLQSLPSCGCNLTCNCQPIKQQPKDEAFFEGLGFVTVCPCLWKC